MNRSWVIGAAPECDHVVRLERVSGRHCRLTIEGDAIFLEDLKSTNGTYVNGVPLSPGVRVGVKRGDAITLGQTIPLPWPPEALAFTSEPFQAAAGTPTIPTVVVRETPIVVGRGSECDQRFDMPMVSTRHARLTRADGQIWIEDLSSANGTFVNGTRIDRKTPVRAGDKVSLGSYVLVIADGLKPVMATTMVLPKIEPNVALSPPLFPTPTPTSMSAAPVPVEAVASEGQAVSGEFAKILRRPARLLGLLVQGPVLGVLIFLGAKMGAQEATVSDVSIAAALFWLVLGALWFGISDAVLGREFEAKSANPTLSATLFPRVLVFAVLGLLQCALAFAVVWIGLGLKGSAPGMLALLLMTAGVGFAIGQFVVTLAPRPSPAWLAVPLVLGTLWLFGGEAWRLPKMTGWARVVASLLPSRWAFEGVLLLESEERGLSATTDAAPPADASDNSTASSSTKSDLAQDYFPAQTERMGERADAFALAAMFIGWVASSAFLSGAPRRGS